MNDRLRLAQIGILYFSLSACAEDGGSPGAYPQPPSEADRQAAEGEVEQARQALGEATCGNTEANAVLDFPAMERMSVLSGDATYDHPTCRDAFIVEVPKRKAGDTLTGGNSWGGVNLQNIFWCWLTWSYTGLWWKDGDNYVLVAEGDAWGHEVTERSGNACSSRVELTLPHDGDYKVVTASTTVFFDEKQPVWVGIGRAQL